jgi:glutaredoxin
MLRKLSGGSRQRAADAFDLVIAEKPALPAKPEAHNVKKKATLCVTPSEARFVRNNFGFWGKKRGAWNKGMKRRWFEVQGSRINYWLKREESKLAGTCRGSIKVVSIAPISTSSSDACELTISADSGRTYSVIVEEETVAEKVRGLFTHGASPMGGSGTATPRPSAMPVRHSRPRGLSTVFAPSADYDHTVSTAENYGAAGTETFGKFAGIRETLDFEYHGNYTKERQIFQDVLLENVTGAGHRYDSPWIVFTAGAMGAGKSHTISWMSSQGYFPLPDFVQLDPDVFRQAFPEWPEYREKDSLNAGHRTHLEAGFLVEIAMQHGLQSGHHIWVDGSLRDHEWFKVLFAKIQREHPQYQIAILFVFADQQVVMERVKQRELITGRVVPRDVLLDSLGRVPNSVEQLTPYVDFVAHIENSGVGEAQLTKVVSRESSHHHLGLELNWKVWREAMGGKKALQGRMHRMVEVDASWKQVSKRFALAFGIDRVEENAAYIDAAVEGHTVVMFSKTYCAYCHRAKEVLERENIEYHVLELDLMMLGTAIQLELEKKTGLSTVPQVFINGGFYGDCTYLLEAHEKGVLQRDIAGQHGRDISELVGRGSVSRMSMGNSKLFDSTSGGESVLESSMDRQSSRYSQSAAQSVRHLGVVGEGEEGLGVVGEGGEGKEEENGGSSAQKDFNVDLVIEQGERDRLLRAAVASGEIDEKERGILMDNPELPLPPDSSGFPIGSSAPTLTRCISVSCVFFSFLS